ncbi:hypothetical protein B5807_01335 [Epicoccum nigrum]|uniref:Uncharacterized protein n=1 Tax=Epicoccum nigrum TaxID=105696 RepID=A0A1Y2MG41_EPING|nr:hypothetical protein B5807_01335 [Epicoccum nigrum]
MAMSVSAVLNQIESLTPKDFGRDENDDNIVSAHCAGNETEALKHFAYDWVNCVANGASIQTTTYGIIARIRTSTRDTNRFEDTTNQILLDNKLSIP